MSTKDKKQTVEKLLDLKRDIQIEIDRLSAEIADDSELSDPAWCEYVDYDTITLLKVA